MAGERWPRDGKLLGLLILVEEHQEAIKYDLLTLGYRLRWLEDEETMRAHDFDWSDVLVIVQAMTRGTALYRSYYGHEEAEWGLGEQLLAHVADSASWLVWSKTDDAERGRNRPKRIPRPGVDDEPDGTNIGGQEGNALPAEDMWAWLEGPFQELDPGTGEPLALPVPQSPRQARNEAILARLSAGATRKAVAAEFGVSTSTVGRVARG